jgi:hypothetical protein
MAKKEWSQAVEPILLKSLREADRALANAQQAHRDATKALLEAQAVFTFLLNQAVRGVPPTKGTTLSVNIAAGVMTKVPSTANTGAGP